MKKVSALLLTAVLGSSMVFAGMGGSVTTTYGYDLDAKLLGFTNDNAVTGAFEFSAEDSLISEGDIHAELTGSLVITTDGDIVDSDESVSFVLDDFDYSAKIVGSNWYVDITDAAGLADYASDFASNDDGDTYHNYEFESSDAPGVTVGYTYEEGKTVEVSVGSSNDLNEGGSNDNFLAIASPEYMLGENLTAEFAVAVQNVHDDFAIGGGTKMTLADEDNGYSMTVAADMGYNDKDFDIEAVVKGNYSLATIDAYFATIADAANDGDEVDYTFDGVGGVNLLSVKVTGDLEEVVENVPLTVYAQLSSMDAADYRMNTGVDYTLAMDEASLVIGIDGGVKFDNKEDFSIGGNVEYTPADAAYVACAEVKYANLDNSVSPSVSVETTTLVNGASLKLGYSGAKFLVDSDTDNTLGAIDLTCEIEF